MKIACHMKRTCIPVRGCLSSCQPDGAGLAPAFPNSGPGPSGFSHICFSLWISFVHHRYALPCNATIKKCLPAVPAGWSFCLTAFCLPPGYLTLLFTRAHLPQFRLTADPFAVRICRQVVIKSFLKKPAHRHGPT